MNSYIAAIDYGMVADRTALCVVHMEGDDVILDKMDVLQGSQADRCPIEKIEQWVLEVVRHFHVAKLVLDVYQMEVIAQKFERKVEVERFNFGGGAHFKLAENLRTLILNKRLRIYSRAGEIRLPTGQTEDLIDELSELIVVEKYGGTQYRLDHLPGKHDDRTICLAMGCFVAVRMKANADPLQTLTNLNKTKRTIFGEEEMYSEIKHIAIFGTWQATPVLNGEEVRLRDYSTKLEAALATNIAHELLGSTAPNTLDKSRMPAQSRIDEIKADIRSLLGPRVAVPTKKKEGK